MTLNDALKIEYDFATLTGTVAFAAGTSYRVADVIDYFADASGGYVETIRVAEEGMATVVLNWPFADVEKPR